MTERANFNFTPEQQEKFTNIYYETKKLHPHLLANEVMKEKVKVLIAYTVINGDLVLPPKTEELEVENNCIEIKD